MNSIKPDLHYIKSALAPSIFYRHELPAMPLPKGGGWQSGDLCPFHDDTKAGNFRVNLDSGAYRCFACDAFGGDIIAFVQKRDGLSFMDTLAHLKRAWGIS